MLHINIDQEMQIKSTTSLTLPQTEGTSSKCLQTIPARIAEILAEYRNWRKYKLVMMAITNRRKGPLNLQTDLHYDWGQSYTSLCIWANPTQKRHIHPYVHCSTVYNPQDMKAKKCSSSVFWRKMLCSMCTLKYYSAKRKQE